jgi:hypothetical protein
MVGSGGEFRAKCPFIVLSRNGVRFRLILSETIRKTGAFARCLRVGNLYRFEETHESAALRCDRARLPGDSCASSA